MFQESGMYIYGGSRSLRERNRPRHSTPWLFPRPQVAPWAGILLFLVPALALGKLCGDDVGSRDVPCACGDVVVSNVTLAADDPVTKTVCKGDGLIVRAPAATEPLTIDLRGKTLRGNGRGVGVWLILGGPGGARVISSGGPATIIGFQDGVTAEGPDSLMLLEDAVVRQPTRDGVDVRASDYTLRAVEVWDAGRDGFSLRGHDFAVETTRAIESARFGYYVRGQRGRLGAAGAGATAQVSGAAGFMLMGAQHRVRDCVALASGKEGLRINGTGIHVEGCRLSGNGDDGMSGMGANLELQDNQADDNVNNGIVVRGMVHDLGGNEGTGNLGAGQQHPAVQCEIGGWPCVP